MFVKMSKDPLGLYTTWIHIKDWNFYMQSLEDEGQTSVRKFMPLTVATHKVMNDLLITVGTRDCNIQDQLSSDKKIGLGLNPDQVKENLTAGQKSKKNVEVPQKALEKRHLSFQALQKGYYFNHGWTTIDVRLDKRKIEAASGKRPGEQSQKAVMGNVSATDVSIIPHLPRRSVIQRS
jgi:hypothetical protein